MYDKNYYRDFAVHVTMAGNNERTILFTHATVSAVISTDTNADYVTIELLVRQKEDKFYATTFGEKLDDTYAAAKKRLENPPRLNIYVPPIKLPNDVTVMGQANPNVEFAAAPLGSYQVVDITGSTITLSLKNMKGMSIAIYELGISQTKPEDLLNKVGKQVRFANFKSDDSKYIIVGLKELTNYNITIADPKERVVLSKPIRTFFGGSSNIIEVSDYEKTYKKQFDAMLNGGSVPLSWSANNETRAQVEDSWRQSDRNFFIREDVVDTEFIYDIKKDGINDRNNDKYGGMVSTFYKYFKSFYFEDIGIRVYECPFKPGYFNVDSSSAMLGKTQCYVELGKKKICNTLKDLDDLDFNHRFDIFTEASFYAFRITLSASADVVTIASLGFAAPEISSIKTFLKVLYKNMIVPGKVAQANIFASNATDFISMEFFKKDLSDWGDWLLSTFVPFVGTTDLIRDFINKQPAIHEVKDEAMSKYTIDAVKGSNGKINGIFFNSNR